MSFDSDFRFIFQFSNKILTCTCIRLSHITDYFAIPMDAAGESNWHKAMVAQGRLVGDQQQHLVELDAKLNMLTSIISTTFVSPQSPGCKLQLTYLQS